MGRYVTLHALLAGFFAFGAVQYFAQWCWSRTERVLLLFALHCVLGVSLSLALLVLGQATSVAEAQLALGARTTIALVWVAASVTLAARITGFEARGFARAITVVLLVTAAVSFFAPAQRHRDGAPDRGGVVGRDVHDRRARAEPGAGRGVPGHGGRLRLPGRRRACAWCGAIASAPRWRAWPRAAGSSRPSCAAFADVGGRTLPYVMDAPSAVWVLLMAMVLSREYADRGERLAAGERRFRAVFDESSELVFLDPARRHAVAGQPLGADHRGCRRRADVVGKPLWDTPWWSHDPQLRERREELPWATRRAACR